MPVYMPRTSSFPAQCSVPKREEASKSNWLRLPHINQLRPDGANEGYRSGAINCGPAVVAMLARGAGRAPGLSDARLIQELGQGLMSKGGASPQDLVTMLERVNLPPAGPALPSSYSDEALRNQLRQGNKLIAQVESVNKKTGESSAHYIVVQGQTRDGHYRILDPLAKGPQVVTPRKLRDLVGGAPPDGGVLIPVGSPRHVTEKSGPEHLRQAFVESPRSERGVCGSMARREERHDFELDINYLSDQAEGRIFRQPVTPDRMSAADLARKILVLKERGNPKALRLLEFLQASPFPRDQRVFDRVRTVEFRQPGIGKKLLGDPT